jgi:choline dehydrogenase-like flavoprotein
MTPLEQGSREERTFDAIVVGSGIAGGWAAKELSEKGLKTLVLERGRQVKHVEDYKTFGMNPWDFRYAGGRTPQDEVEKHYFKQQRTGYTVNDAWNHWFVKDDEHPYTEVSRFDWIRGYHVGGRSITWGRQSYRHSDLDFEANAKEGVGIDWPIRYADLAPWYDHVERWIGVSGTNEGLPQLPDGVFQPALEYNVVEKSFKGKVESKFPERRITMGRTAHITKPTDEQLKLGRGTCQSRNLCMRGCAFGAYFSSNSGTLIAADHTGNMTLQPDSVVTEVIFDPKTQKATGVRVLNTGSKTTTEYYAKVIFLCASALATTWIMLHSKSDRFPNGLGNDSDELGRNVMDHHFLAGAQADVDGYEDRYYSGRRPSGIYVPRFRNLGDSRTKQNSFTRGYGYQGGASRSGWQRLVAEMGFGKDLKDEISEAGDWTMGLTGFGEMLPYRDNRVWINNDVKDVDGLPTLTFDVTIRENELNMRKDMQTSAMEMMEAAGFKNVRGFDRPYAPGLGIHEMGTARMGRDEKTSVLNGWNQVHACKNVYVTDGAAMTSAACVNPSLTYMALTARAANHAVEALKRGEL